MSDKMTPEQLMNHIHAEHAYVKRSLDFILNDGQTELPATTPNQGDITWHILSGEAYIQNNIIYKKETATENQPITLQATVSHPDYTTEVYLEGFILKDAYTAHLMTYFNHAEGPKSGENPEAGMRLAYSYDGLDWYPLNNGHGVVNEKGGTTNWLRDPHAFRKKDGTFGVVATQGWDTPYIFMWDSEDMVTFTEHYLQAARKGPVDHNPQHDLTGKRAWAPKVMYDHFADYYYVFWSDPKDPHAEETANDIDRPLYYNHTRDFAELSEPKVYFNTGYPVIDASIVKEKGVFYMFFKDERLGEKCIRVASSLSLDPGSFSMYEDLASDPNEKVEGPFAFRSLKDDSWYLYYDDFSTDHTYKVSRKSELTDKEWEHLGIIKDLPITKLDYKTRISHGGHIYVTQKELDRILAAWDK